MVDYVTVGTSAIAMLAEDPAIGVPILGHFAAAGGLYAGPWSGIAPHLVMGMLPRLAGADVLVYPSPYGSLRFERSEHLRLADAMTAPLHGIRPAMPMPGGGLHAGMVPLLLGELGPDHAFGAGGSIHGHPMGTTAGARAIRQAFDAAASGRPLAEAAREHPELAAALEAWPEVTAARSRGTDDPSGSLEPPMG
jgi:2,3-diketo-5-methylthiopentyl-1-phosphate enolase